MSDRWSICPSISEPRLHTNYIFSDVKRRIHPHTPVEILCLSVCASHQIFGTQWISRYREAAHMRRGEDVAWKTVSFGNDSFSVQCRMRRTAVLQFKPHRRGINF